MNEAALKQQGERLFDHLRQFAHSERMLMRDLALHMARCAAILTAVAPKADPDILSELFIKTYQETLREARGLKTL